MSLRLTETAAKALSLVLRKSHARSKASKLRRARLEAFLGRLRFEVRPQFSDTSGGVGCPKVRWS